MGATYKFYYPNGDEIRGENSRKEFVDFYSKVYHYEYKKRALEIAIREILKNGVSTTDDIVNILLWKTWVINCDTNSVTVRGRDKNGNRGIMIDAEKLWDTLEKPAKELPNKKCGQCTKCDQCTKCVACDTLENLLKQHDGIGPVYAITLLHFISKGEFPIYDKYAHIALKVILDEKRQFEPPLVRWPLITDRELGEEFNTKDAKAVFKSYQENYIDRLKRIFDEDYKTYWEIDRALWVYGHMFYNTKTNQQRSKSVEDLKKDMMKRK